MPSDVPEAHCPGCGALVDPLRAGQVAILEGRFEYFCDADCKRTYLRAGGVTSHDDLTAEPPPVASVEEAAPISAPPSQVAPASSDVPPIDRLPAGRDRVLAVLDVAGVFFGVLVVALGLLEGSELARVAFAAAAWLALAARTWRAPRDAADPSPLLTVLPTAVATCVAGWAQAVGDPHSGAITALVGIACSASIMVEGLTASARGAVTAERSRIAARLDVPVRVVRFGEPVEVAAAEVRPGEPLLALAGDVVGVDAVVSGGEARVVPWLDAGIEVTRREGDSIVAGAKVVSSRLRLTTTWSGRERAWVKLLSVPRRRIDVAAPTARTLRRGLEWGAPAAGVLAALAALAANASFVQVVAVFAAGAIAVASRGAPSLVALVFSRAHLRALARGITYRDAQAFERAGATDIAVLSARGTVLLGEPEIVAIEPVGSPSRSSEGPAAESAQASEDRVLALASGAETGSTHPFATAILRAALARGITPDHVRNTNTLAGLGVTAIASTGERLVVGGRAIMLSEKVGGAVVEARVSRLEAEGRSVLLVALGDRLIGLIALQDGLRPGARAAVQKLLDAGVEPVLLSGESRDTCETIARALDIEHVRPEVLPGDRRAEVLALGEGGSIVSVVARPVGGDQALGAADVAVAMGAAGATPGEWAVALANDDVSHAADALVIPRRALAQARVAIALALAPGIFALLAIAFGTAPLALAPVASLVGALAAWLHVRSPSAPSAS